MNRKKYLLLLLALSVFMFGCSRGGTSQEDSNKDQEGKIKVLTSFFVIEDFAKRIGGDKVEVESFIPNGQAPHGWEPSPQDIAKINDAQVFIYNGGGFESWAEDVLESLQPDKTLIVQASKGIEMIPGHSHEGHEAHGEEAAHEDHEGHEAHGEEATHEDHEDHEGHDHPEATLDPHVWTSPKLAIGLAKNIYLGLAEKDPDNKDYYEENFKTLEKALLDLDKSYTERLAPAQNRDIVVSHEAYGYMAKEYDLNQIPIEGINSQLEPDPKTMQKIVDYVKENNISTIFTEPLMDPKVAETIAKETGAQVAVLDPLEGLSSNMTNEGQGYFEIMEENLLALEKALVE